MSCRGVVPLAGPVAGLLAVTVLGSGCANNRESAAARASRNTGTATAVAGSDGVQQVVVNGNEQFRFVPSTIDAQPGRLRIILTSSGGTPHNLRVADRETGLVGAGEKAQITVTLAPGRHLFVCTLHTRLHMMGTIVVS